MKQYCTNWQNYASRLEQNSVFGMALDMCKKGDMMWDLLIKNADYVSEHQIEHGNIYVKDGKIAAIS